MERTEIKKLFDVSKTIAAEYLEGFVYPWEALEGIGKEIKRLFSLLSPKEYYEITEGVFAARGAKISDSARIGAPCIIGPNAQIRHCAFIRGNAIIGADAVIGNSTEIKNSILFDGVQVPHYNYVGDSILGYRAHLGAGAVTSNVKSDRTNVKILMKYDTGRYKVGAAVGDCAEIGCNSVLNPGTIIGRNSIVYPTSCVRGIVPQNCIFKNDGSITEKRFD